MCTIFPTSVHPCIVALMHVICKQGHSIFLEIMGYDIAQAHDAQYSEPTDSSV